MLRFDQNHSANMHMKKIQSEIATKMQPEPAALALAQLEKRRMWACSKIQGGKKDRHGYHFTIEE